MKKMRLFNAAMALMLALIFAVGAMPVAAEEGPVGACPAAFELHHVGHHGGMGGGEMGDHQHAGLSMEEMDANGDGYVCMKKVGANDSIHVHVDNNLPLKKL